MKIRDLFWGGMRSEKEKTSAQDTYGQNKAERSGTETPAAGGTAGKSEAETYYAIGTRAADRSNVEKNRTRKNVTEETDKTGFVFGWKCQECGKIFIGRSGQKFCSLECKNKFNNRRNSKIRRYRAGIIRRLGKNYEILQSMMHSRCRSFKLEDLNALGFDRNCVTGYDTSGKKKIYRCYDIKYSLSENRLYDIQREELLDD